MNKWMKWISVGVAGVIVLSPAATTRATIVGSAHDFTYAPGGWNTMQTLCGVCHVAHNANNPQLIPLWGHQTTSQTFTPYDSPTLNASPKPSQPGNASKACLSCHDGTVAVNNFGTTTNGSYYVTGSALLSPDLSNDHPISFVYDTALATADGFLHDPSTVVPLLGGKTIAQAMLIGGRMECSSCHDVHKQKGTSATSQQMLLIGGPAGVGSKLCLTCHDK